MNKEIVVGDQMSLVSHMYPGDQFTQTAHQQQGY